MTEKLLNSDLEYNYRKILENIEKASLAAGGEAGGITLLAATKTVSTEVINSAVSLGISHIGENRVQELLEKYDYYDLTSASLHFIGHLQTNKVRQIVGKVSMIQSVDSIKLAREISKQSEKLGLMSEILIEVNIGREQNKSGVLPEALSELVHEAGVLEAVKIRGLMAIPPVCAKKHDICKYFSDMRQLFIDIRGKKIDNIDMHYLSMGMSDDYTEAISCGSNLVRIGSALFGGRI